jgi:hypothetical protein
MSRELPAKPNLEYLKKQAKELLNDFQRGEHDAVERFRTFASSVMPANAKLADAQQVITRDYGFASWPKLKQHADSFTLTPIEQLVAAVCAQNAERVAQLLKDQTQLKAAPPPGCI